MSDLTFNFNLLFKLVIYVLLPTIALVLISRVLVVLCTKKIKENDPERYYHIVNSWLSIVAILITIALFVVTIIYAFYFVSAMKEKNLVSTHQVMYYLVFAFPVVPFIFLIYYIVGLLKFRKLRKAEDQESFYQDQRMNDITTQKDSSDYFSGFTTPNVSFPDFSNESSQEPLKKEESKEENSEKKNIELL